MDLRCSMTAGVREAEVGAAVFRRHVGVARGEALEVRLVDDGAAPDDLGALLAAPVEVVVHHHAARNEGRRVARVELGPAVRHQRPVVVHLPAKEPRVRVHQQLVGVEDEPFAGAPGAVHAPGVERAGAKAGHVAVPHAVGRLGETKARLGAVLVEETEVDRRACCVDGEVHAVAIERSAERVMDSGSQRIRSHEGRSLRRFMVGGVAER